MMPLLFFAFLAVMFGSLGLGHYPVSSVEILKILMTSELGTNHDPDDFPWIVIWMVRMPRILMVAISGMGLSLVGVVMQGVFRNPLVGPEVLGVSSGAAFGGVLAIVLGWSSLPYMIVSAFIFGGGALIVALIITRLAGHSGILGFILAGVIISAFFGALVGLAQYVADPNTQLAPIIFWLMGSFAAANFKNTAFLAAVILIAGTPLVALSWRMNLLSLGEDDARSLGLNVNRLRLLVVILASLIVAGQVSVSGGVGWVGLIIPHLARMLVGPEHSRLMPVSALMGGIYLMLIDNLARSLTRQEIPISLLTAVLGAPVFVILFVKLQNKGWVSD
ncbi:MAG: iron ABC transporter permease [Deltaproteobacteria bacterium]|nr:iron ABC transporter permease [Deltaproteobacteria bacterium]